MAEKTQAISPSTQSSAEPAPNSTAPASSPRTLLDEYDLGDTQNDEVFDNPPAKSEPPAAESLPAAGSSSETPRDPETGRFLPKDDISAASQHSRHTVQQALDLGWSDEEIAATAPEALADQVYKATRAALRVSREQTREDSLMQATERRSSVVPRAPVQAVPEAEEEVNLGIDEKLFDPDLMGALKKLEKERRAELKALRAEVAELRTAEAFRQDMSNNARIDRVFAKHEKILGKGRGDDFDHSSPEFQRRLSVLALVDRDKSKAPIAAKIDKAVSILFGTQAPSTEVPQRRGPSPEQWANSVVERPTQRSGAAEPKGEEKAMRTAAALLQEMNAGLDEGTEEEGFLD